MKRPELHPLKPEFLQFDDGPCVKIGDSFFSLKEYQMLLRNQHIEEMKKPVTDANYHKPQYYLFLSEMDLDILLFKLFNNNHPPMQPTGTLPQYPGEKWLEKKIMIAGKLRLLSEVLQRTFGKDDELSWEVIKEI